MEEEQHLLADCRRIGDILARIGDTWTILVLTAIGNDRRRFGELHRAVDGISQRMLTVTLRHLEQDGIVTRTVHPTIPPRVEYELSVRGRSLMQALSPVGRWVIAYRDDIERSRSHFETAPDRTETGGESE